MMTEKPATRQGRRMVLPRTVRRLLLFGAALYIAPLLGLAAFQRQLVFNAGYSRKWGASDTAALPVGARRISFQTETGDRVTAYYGRALRADGSPDPDAARRPTLLFFYGKAGSVAGCRAWFDSFQRLDVNVLMPDYVGFGQSGGQESEANCFATAEAAYGYLSARPDVDPKTIVIAGYSLGSGVAVDLAARALSAGRPVAGLALFAAYTSLADEAHQEYPVYPAFLLRLLLRSPFASEQKMPRITCPVLIVHSRADRLIPFWMADRLAAASGGPVTRRTITRAGHADYFRVEGQAVFGALGRFIEKVTLPHETQERHERRAAPHRVRAARAVPQAPRAVPPLP